MPLKRSCVNWAKLIWECRNGSRWKWKRGWAGSVWKKDQSGEGFKAVGRDLHRTLSARPQALWCAHTLGPNTFLAGPALVCTVQLSMKQVSSQVQKRNLSKCIIVGGIMHKRESDSGTTLLQRWHFTISLHKHSLSSLSQLSHKPVSIQTKMKLKSKCPGLSELVAHGQGPHIFLNWIKSIDMIPNFGQSGRFPSLTGPFSLFVAYSVIVIIIAQQTTQIYELN